MFDKKVILITGASSGLGYLTVKHLCNLGHTVIAAIRDIDSKNKTVIEELNDYVKKTNAGRIFFLEIDLESITSIDSFATKLYSLIDNSNDIDGLDILINNGGLGAMGLVEHYSIKQAKQLFDVNFFAPIALTQHCLPLLKKSAAGCVINISSSGGRVCLPLLGYYCASKYALEAISECQAVELADLNIKLHIIEPGSFPTNLHANRLPHENKKVNSYPRMEKLLNKMEKGLAAATNQHQARDPAEFVNKVAELIESNNQNKILRHVVGTVATDGVREINQFNDEIQMSIFNKYGLDKK